MSDPKVEPTKHVGLRLSENMVAAIRKSGQSAPDWFRQAARNRLESERNSGNPPAAGDGRMSRLEPEIVQLRKEIAKLQQSESIAQAALLELRRTLVAIQQNQAAI